MMKALTLYILPSLIRGDLLSSLEYAVNMENQLPKNVSNGNLHAAAAQRWMWSAFEVIGEIITPEKEGWAYSTKIMVNHKKSLSEGRESSFKYCQGPYVDIYI